MENFHMLIDAHINRSVLSLDISSGKLEKPYFTKEILVNNLFDLIEFLCSKGNKKMQDFLREQPNNDLVTLMFKGAYKMVMVEDSEEKMWSVTHTSFLELIESLAEISSKAQNHKNHKIALDESFIGILREVLTVYVEYVKIHIYERKEHKLSRKQAELRTKEDDEDIVYKDQNEVLKDLKNLTYVSYIVLRMVFSLVYSAFSGIGGLSGSKQMIFNSLTKFISEKLIWDALGTEEYLRKMFYPELDQHSYFNYHRDDDEEFDAKDELIYFIPE